MNDHNALKAILLYQSVLEYLKHRDLVQKMEVLEIESFYAIIKECFQIAYSYNGSLEDIKHGCEQIINSKTHIMKFYPNLENDLK